MHVRSVQIAEYRFGAIAVFRLFAGALEHCVSDWSIYSRTSLSEPSVNEYHNAQQVPLWGTKS